MVYFQGEILSFLFSCDCALFQISGVTKICSVIFVFMIIFLVDQIVVDVMDIITTHNHITYEQEGIASPLNQM